MNITDLMRPNIRNLKPYTSARDLYSGGILLDANENAFGPAVDREPLILNRYPDPHQVQLRKAISTVTGLPENALFFGVGSDEIIDLLIRIFCEPARDAILLLEPTYGMYRVAADINNVAVKELLLDETFLPNAEYVLSSDMDGVKILFLCSPNNPTGNLIPKSIVREICKSVNCLVVLDEAYIDFAGEGSSMADEVAQYPNLIILRTFSKAWGLAGIRAGYCVAAPEVIAALFAVKAPYTMNVLTEAVILEAVKNVATVKHNIDAILEQKQLLQDELLRVLPGCTIFNSDANFFLLRFPKARFLQLALAGMGIIIRDRSTQPGLENCVRITIGTAQENTALIAAITTVLKEMEQ